MLTVFGTPSHVIEGPDPVKLISERASCSSNNARVAEVAFLSGIGKVEYYTVHLLS